MDAVRKAGAPVPLFEVHFEETTLALRAALIELLSAARADTERPQEIARQFGLNKNLTWKLTKIVHGTDAVSWAPHVPGKSGIRIALDALTPHAGDDRRQAVEETFAAFEDMVKLHAGDRTTLELMLGSLRPETVPAERLEMSRKLSFQGNSATWGCYARVRFGLQVDAPNRKNSDLIDIGTVHGLLGLRRLRPTGSWPLARVGGYGGDITGWRPIDDRDYQPGEIPLMRDFCSEHLPEMQIVDVEDGKMFELEDGPVGNAAELSLVFGSMTEKFGPIHADEEGDVGEHYLRLDGPVEHGIFDLLVHKDLPIELPPGVTLYSMMQGLFEFPLSATHRLHLPCPADLQELGEGPPAMATPHVPEYSRILEQVLGRMGHDLSEFRGYRVEMSYPPIPTILVLHYPLAARG